LFEEASVTERLFDSNFVNSVAKVAKHS